MASRYLQRRIGLSLMAAALVVAVVAVVPAVAQEPTTTTVDIQATALITYPINDVVPNTLIAKGFPPNVVCLVFTQACPEELEPVRDPIAGALGEVDANQQTSPLQPANPDGLTLTFFGGTERYASAVEFSLPTIPADHVLDEFVLTFPQGQPSFSFDSPMFREAVDAIIQTAGSQDPAVFQEQLAQVFEEQPLTQPQIGIEACPLTVPIPEDAAAPRSASVADISEDEGNGPAINCLYGSNGRFEDGAWSFDLTFAVNAWRDGTLENHGILLRPTGAPNLAFGDPDTSTNAQVVLDIANPPKATVASSAAPEPLPSPDPVTPPPPSTPPSAATAPSTISAPPSSSLFVPPPPTPVTPSTPVAPPAAVAPPQPRPQPTAAPTVVTQTTPASVPRNSPWLLALIPAFAGGAWLTARSLTEELVVGSSRGGALTRLVAASTS